MVDFCELDKGRSDSNKMLGNCSVAKQLTDSQEGLSSLESVICGDRAATEWNEHA